MWVYLMSLEGHDVLVLVRVRLAVLDNDLAHVTAAIDGPDSETVSVGKERETCEPTEISKG
jgi:hypothetical protein